MAKPISVWGVDLGQCALKALRCRIEDGRVIADAFDYIEYPKMLNQPEADPDQLIKEALEQFLSRNEVKGHKVAVSLPGQSGLARFFKPPPVDAKKLPEIVKYEARQQIPFPLDEVIWDYQSMGGGTEIDGVQIDAEVGLFAMKREQVLQLIKPYEDAGIELDVVQLSPFAVYNYVATEINPADDSTYDPSDPPESLVVLSMGTDTTDLVITNGVRVWQRSIPLGGNEFTKQLTKEMKLTFAKAEQTKRNARKAEDPKKIFQAMRPVFTDLVNEVQRTVGFFQSLDRSAKIKGVMIMGNAVKLPGLQEFLSKNLGYEVVKFQGFEGVEKGGEIAESPNFKENSLAYGIAYGLCLQALDKARLQTNLIPREILTERLIRGKKPWVAASLGALILACTMNTFFTKQQWQKVHEDASVENVSWKQAQDAVTQLSSTSTQYNTKHKSQQATLDLLTELGKEVVGNNDRRVLWLELMSAIYAALPKTPGFEDHIPTVEEMPFDKRHELHITKVETEYFDDLATWFDDDTKNLYIQGRLSSVRLEEALAAGRPAPPAPQVTEEPAADDPAAAEGGAAEGATAEPATPPEPEPTAEELARAGLAELTGPAGPGWVIEFTAHHHFNSDKRFVGDAHVRHTLIKFLEEGKIRLPRHPDRPDVTEEFTLKELGIDFAIAARGRLNPRGRVLNPAWDGSTSPAMGYGEGGMDGMDGMGGMGGMGMGMEEAMAAGASDPSSGMGGVGGMKKKEDEIPQYLTVPRYDFIIQFVWQEQPLSDRLAKLDEERRLAEEEAKKQAEAATAEGGN